MVWESELLDKRKIPLNEDEETRRKIEAEEHEMESRADGWQTFKVIGIFVLQLLVSLVLLSILAIQRF